MFNNLSLSWKSFASLPARIFISFMYSPLVSCQICLFGWLKIAFSARILDSYMYCPLVSSQISPLRKLFTTLPARILYVFPFGVQPDFLLIPSCTALLYSSRYLFLKNSLPQCLHAHSVPSYENIILSLLLLICWWRNGISKKTGILAQISII